MTNKAVSYINLPFLLSVEHTLIGTRYVAIAGEHQQLCMHGQRLCGLQEAAQPSASEPAHQDSGNALQQVFARQAIKLFNLYAVTTFLLCEKQSSHTACTAIMKNASHEVSDA